MKQLNRTDGKLDFVIEVLTALDKVYFDDQSNSIHGYLGARSTSSFTEISEKLESFDIDTSDNDSDKNIFVIPLTSTNVYFNINHYLKNNIRRLDVKPLNEFYLYFEAVRYIPHVNSDSRILNNIFTMANLFSNLKLISDLDGNTGNQSFIIFVGKKNLKITSQYVAEDLNADFASVNKFIREYIQNEFHQEDRHLAVKNGLHESYKSNEVSLSVFIKGFDTFYRMVKSNFQLYMDKFSFDDFKDKVEEDRREYTIKINKVFSDMQNQLLTLPIATVLAAGQMGFIDTAGSFIKNVLIVIGIIIFCIFVLMQISNQETTLKALDDEIGLRRAAMGKKEDTDYKNKYVEVYSQLDTRIDKLDNNLSLVKSITIAATVLVILVFFARFFI